MNKKAFILSDGIVIVFLVMCLFTMLIYLYGSLDNYSHGYNEYIKEENMRLESTFMKVSTCYQKPKVDIS